MNENTAKPNGLTTVINTIVSPKEAFETLRDAPTWGWAFLIAAILMALGVALTLPAMHHAFAITWQTAAANNPKMAQSSPEQQAKSLAVAQWFVGALPIVAVVQLLFGILIQTVIMLIFSAVGRGEGTFKKLWTVSANIAIVIGLQAIVTGLIATFLGVDHFNTFASIQGALPSLAAFAPQGRLGAFLAAVNPFAVWMVGLTICAMMLTARVSKGVAWATGIVNILLVAVLAATFYRPG